MGDKGGACDRCLKEYLVKYHLTKIRLTKIFVPRDYETEILAYITRKGKSYAGEISSHVGASKGVVSHTLRSMESKGLIKIVPRGKTKWVMLPGTEYNYRRT
jgi:sugar-specific transcriptional regulator TrmB